MEQERTNNFYGNDRVWKAGWIVLILLSVFLVSKTISEIKGWSFVGKSESPQTTISVSGKGEILVKPDIATFSFGIQEESLIVGEAQDKVAKSEGEILAFLKENGVAEADIKVSDYSIYPRYNYVRTYDVYDGGKQVLAAYVVSESVEVKVRKISDAGKLIGSMGELGATNLSGLTFGIDKQDDVMKQAREKAIADAKVSAEKLADELGVSLVRIVDFSESGVRPPAPYYYEKAALQASDASGVNPELPAGTNKIISNVSVTYEIK